MFKKIFLVVIVLGSVNTSYSQWAKSIGGTLTDNGRSIVVDGSGNVYMAGSFQGTVDFDPGAGTTNLTSAGSDDIFFAKYGSNGDIVWAKSAGGTSGDFGYSIAVDASGNVYVTGYFGGTADFDPGAGTTNLTSAGSNDVFFAKYNSNGDIVWAKSVGGTSGEYGRGIAVDGSGNVYVTGNFNGTADFDPGVGTTNLTSAGIGDIFFAKYDSNGNIVWAKSVGGTSDEAGYGIAVDGSGNVYVTGYFYGTADFDPGAVTTSLASTGQDDVFFAKYNSNGDLVWAKDVGGTLSDLGNGIAVDASGNVYITGETEGTADFDPGAGTTNLTSAGGYDVFFAKYNSSGDLVWAKTVGGTLSDIGRSIIVDGSGNVYVAGSYTGTADFDPGAGTTNLTSAGSSDIFTAKYNSTGVIVWANSAGGTSGDSGNSIAVDASGNVLVTGYFQGTADFDPGTGTTNLTSAGGNDVFFAKYSSDGTLPVELNSFTASITANSVSLNWQTATEVNVYGFDIERALVEIRHNSILQWKKIGFVPGSGSSNSTKSYSFTDQPTGGTNFSYRLKQIDNDGNFKYYDAIALTLNLSSQPLLMDNYPNPFNPSTSIKFYLPKEENVSLKVYDLLGREVITLIDQQTKAGYHIVYWNGRNWYGENVSSGIYFYRLSVESAEGKKQFINTKKMLLLK